MNDTMTPALRRLLGGRLIEIGRAADLQHFTFSRPDAHGGTLELHVVCPWRVVGSAGILAGRADYRRPAAADTTDEAFDRGAVGARFLDVRNASIRGLLGDRGLEVVEANADGLGGLVIRLSSGLSIEIFPDASSASHDELEFWRLVEPDGPHLVISTDGLDYVTEQPGR